MDPQLEVFVLHAYDTTLQIRVSGASMLPAGRSLHSSQRRSHLPMQGTSTPPRCLLFKLEGQPVQRLPLDASEVSFAPLASPEV